MKRLIRNEFKGYDVLQAVFASASVNELELPPAEIPAVSVHLAATRPGRPCEEVPFTDEAELEDDRFTAMLSGLPRRAPSIVWTRAWLGQACTIRTTDTER